MAIDQGTTSTRVCLITADGRLAAQQGEAFPQIYPRPGWVEHDPETIWSTTLKSIQAVMSGRPQGEKIAAIGITNQRETVVVWDAETGRPVMNAIVWQCRRTQDLCEKLKKAKKQNLIRGKTGLVLDPYFSATKIQWILKNVPGAAAKAKAGRLRAGTIDSFLLWRLTGGRVHATDVSNASRTMLMNIHRGEWDKDLLKLFGVPASMLPEIRPSSGEFGRTQGLGVLPDGIPITGIAGDQQAALFGQAAFNAGEAKCTFGTGSFLLMNTGLKPVPSKAKLLTTIAWKLGDQKTVYALEGGAFVCGAAVQWLRDGLGLFEKSSDVEKLAASVPDTGGVEFVPALTGLGAPHWRAEARGVITGLTRGTTKAHLARATLEAMALQNAEILFAMQKDLKRKLGAIRVDGGAAANDLLMQMQADFLGADVLRPVNVETTAMGAAYLAGLGAGVWTDLAEIRRVWALDREFRSRWGNKERRARLEKWLRAVQKT
ncbi:MAG: glycerol kinase GlpK [Bdellovibrionaceae bacterium]|nr:glycerol kinase GlpK [Pseudobdellovibrionaceae bacterium]MBX3032294.1 glycerol kinase GlpK [Pseudobdellovibrionaceae bacterium]